MGNILNCIKLTTLLTVHYKSLPADCVAVVCVLDAVDEVCVSDSQHEEGQNWTMRSEFS